MVSRTEAAKAGPGVPSWLSPWEVAHEFWYWCDAKADAKPDIPVPKDWALEHIASFTPGFDQKAFCSIFLSGVRIW